MRSAEAFAPDLFAKAEKARGEEAHGCPHPGGMRQRHTRLSALWGYAPKAHGLPHLWRHAPKTRSAQVFLPSFFYKKSGEKRGKE